jgi:hypothetical protein
MNETSIRISLVMRGSQTISDANSDPGSGAILTPGSGILDLGWIEKTGSGINNPDHISESLETLQFFDVDPGSGMEKILIRDKHAGSATLQAI